MVQQMSAVNEKKKLEMRVTKVIASLIKEKKEIAYDEIVQLVENVRFNSWGHQSVCSAVHQKLRGLEKDKKIVYVGNYNYHVVV